MSPLIRKDLIGALVLALLVSACGNDDQRRTRRPANVAPVADAGADVAANEGSAVTLSGAGSSDSDGTIAAYEWTQADGPSVVLAGADAVSASFVAPATDAVVTLTFRLRVTDDDGGTASDDVVVTVNPVTEGGGNTAPTISDIANVTVAKNRSAGPISFTVADLETDAASLAVTATSDNAALLPPGGIALGGNGATRTITLTPVNGTTGSATVTVTVSDGTASASDSFVLTVTSGPNATPVANAGADQVVDEGAAVTLDGAASTDADGEPLTYRWQQTAGPEVTLANANTAMPAFTAPDVTGDPVLEFELTVADAAGAGSTDRVAVTVLDTRRVSVADAAVIEGSAGTTALEFAVTITPAAARAMTLEYTTADGTARAPADYAPGPGTLTIAAGAESATLAVTVVADTFQENDESFTLALAAASGAIIDDGVATGTIDDDDDKRLLRIGAAKAVISPCDQEIPEVCLNHIEGVDEARLGGEPVTHRQRFNLGGFGINPFQNVPDDPAGLAPMGREALTQPADIAAYDGSHGLEDTHVRVMVVEPVDGPRVAFVMIDAVGAGNLVQKAVKEAINAAACDAGACFAPKDTPGEDIGNIVFGQTHSHAGADLQGLWGGVPDDWVRNILVKRAALAAVEAIGDLRPARLTLRQGQALEFNSHRRQNLDGDDEADGTLTLLTATADDATPVGSILQFNAHPTEIDSEPTRVVHADYIQGAMDWLESTTTGAGGVALYYNGPIADASASARRANCSYPADDHPANGFSDAPFGANRCRGEGIAQAAQQFAPRELAPSVVAAHVPVTLPITNPGFLAFGLTGTFNRYYDFMMLPAEQVPGVGPLVKAQMVNLPQLTPVASTLVSRITIGGPGGLEIVTIPGEATNTFGQYIRQIAAQQSPGSSVMLLGLTQNSFGYIIPEDEFNYVNPGHLDDDNENSLVDVPFTSYEEFVSLGPLTAPLLRLEGYNPLFGIGTDDARNLPPMIGACMEDPLAEACALSVIGRRLEYIQSANAQACRNNGLPEEFCSLFDPQTPLYQQCIDSGLPHDTCQVFGGEGGGGGGSPLDDLVAAIDGGLNTLAEECRARSPIPGLCVVTDTLAGLLDDGLPPGGGGGSDDAALAVAAADAATRGCDLLDPSHCLFPFPSDHFTVPAAAGSPQGEDAGGTGRRVNFNVAAMPRNSAGKPIDPTEWNRNDGFSPGQLILTYVPNIATVKGPDGKPLGPIAGAVPITDLEQYADEDAPILVLDAETGERHPIWAEINLDAGYLLPMQGFGPRDDKKPALMIRPAKNLLEGRRYVVVLRSLKDEDGNAIPAQLPFQVCRDALSTNLPPLQARCAALDEKVFPVLVRAGVMRDASLYLAWDFTVASGHNNVGRLQAMRDDAFGDYLGEGDDAPDPGEPGYPAGAAPRYTITSVEDFADGKTVRRIKGTMTVPSYVVAADPSPLDAHPDFIEFRRSVEEKNPDAVRELREMCRDTPVHEADPVDVICNIFSPGRSLGVAASGSLPPNRLHYLPDESSAAVCDPDAEQFAGGCALQARFGDGLPDRNPVGELTTTFTCNIPRAAVGNKPSMDAATAEDVVPVRPTLYGHGLLGGHGEGDGQASDFGNRYGFMTCATDWFGFASGDVPNVATALVDLSNFPVIPDGTQQGVLNQLFLARLAVHPEGFAADHRFQVEGRPVFDRREVFYHGNSQGGIVGGVVVAASKDISRGVLGVPGMNYSTLLSRSTDFALYSVPLYLSYQDDLERPFVISLMQMLWDRSENNGYAHHMTTDAMGGPDNQILLHPAFADHQVTMWSADVMARTIGARVDRQRVLSSRHPDDDAAEYALLEPLDYAIPDHAAGSALVPFDQDWLTTNDSRGDCRQGTDPAPIGNVPPNRSVLFGAGPPFEEDAARFNTDAGADPHECPRRDPQARCQMAHFLSGALIDPARASRTLDQIGEGACPSLPEPAQTQPAGLTPAPAHPLAPLDDGLDELALACHESAGPFRALCALADALADAITDDDDGAVGGVAHASCASGGNTAGGRHYQVKIPSETGEIISFEVFEPAGGIQCADGAGAPGAHPLIVHAHGFGGSRITDPANSAIKNYLAANYAVISFDQRGFGDSTGTVRVLDPDVEGRDIVRILDWAERNLDYLAYRDEDPSSATHGQAVRRPAAGVSDVRGVNLLVGTIGGSYGGGFQLLLHAVDEKNRLDALAPDITWHDLRYSLNPGDTLKTAWSLLLSAGGEGGSFAPGAVDAATSQNPARFLGPRPNASGMDPYIREVLVRGATTGEFPREALEWFRYHSPTYWCGLNDQPQMRYEVADWGDADPNTLLTGANGPLGNEPGDNRRTGQPAVDVLLTQGIRDTLFNFNEAWWNYQCLVARGGDVRLLTHESGHILPDNANVPEQNKFQRPGGSRHCGGVDRDVATLQWFNEKLRGASASTELAETGGELCLSLGTSDAVMVPAAELLAPGGSTEYYDVTGVGASNVPQGVLAESLFAAGANRAVVPLLQVTNADSLIVAGIPQADIRVTTPGGLNDAGCDVGTVPSLRTGCDSVVYVGLGVKRAGSATWSLVDDQITPVRGLGRHEAISLVGVAERLGRNDELALLIYGYHPQYLASYSRDVTIPVVNVSVDLQLPLYAQDPSSGELVANPVGAVTRAITSGDCTNPDSTAVNPQCFATGTATNMVRQLCDYQWLPGVCDAVKQADPAYRLDDEPNPESPLVQRVGAVHEHSSYSDGDPTAIPRDYFNAAKTGHNLPDAGSGDTGVKLDFMFSSEHSDNEKLPATTAAVCAQTFIAGFEAMAESFGEQDPGPFTAWLSGQGPATPATVVTDLLKCQQFVNPDHYFKWQATLEQAMAASNGTFTAVRGFEWTNDYYNHMNVYFSTNVVNVKVDGSYASMDRMWDWLRRSAAEGGGADALVTFNHPGGNPALTPFDGDQPHNDVLAARGDSNWNDLEYVADVDDNVAGIEVNGGDDLEWYVKALTRGWHVGPVAAEDEHQREWSSANEGKTLILTRGRGPQDYYWALKHHRTVAIRADLVGGGAGQPAIVPTIHFWADGETVQDGWPLGSVIPPDTAPALHALHVEISGVPDGYRIAMVGNVGGQAAVQQLGTATNAAFSTTVEVTGTAGGEDWRFIVVCPAGEMNCGGNQNYSAVTAPIWINTPGAPPPETGDAGYGTGVLGAVAGFLAELNDAITAALAGDPATSGETLAGAAEALGEDLAAIGDAQTPGEAIGLESEPDEAADGATSAEREVEVVVLTGNRLASWSVPPAQGTPYPYPSGANVTGQGSGSENLAFLDAVRDPLRLGEVRDAHNGVMVYPPAGAPGELMGHDVTRLAAYRFENGAFVEIPVQVDQRFPYFLANAGSTFSIYSGTDEELTYEWDTERWGNPYPDVASGKCLLDFSDPATPTTRDPVAGLDDDDEIAFMWKDGGEAQAAAGALPAISDPDFDASLGVQEVALVDPLGREAPRFVYLGFKKPGATGAYHGAQHYVNYRRHSRATGDAYEADQWIDSSFFTSDDTEKLGTNLRSYGPNRPGMVCGDAANPQPDGQAPRPSTVGGVENGDGDRFPRDGTTVQTSQYRWEATGRWMVRKIQLANPAFPGGYAPDMVDRWKGRAFQQNADSYVNLIGGFENEQTNWEANSTLLGDRIGPVRYIREVWGADSGTNVTKTETFYRDAVAYRYHVRVHPIPTDGLYTSWDYNRSAMLPQPGDAPGTQGGRYYTALRPQGVPIDGQNDDIGNVDGIASLGGQCFDFGGPGSGPERGGRCPMYVDVPDPTFNPPLAFDNWEQVAGKTGYGSLVYTFEIKGMTSLGNPLVAPYYRDDECFDDSTGDDPVVRPQPGTPSYNIPGYADRPCHERQGAFGSHGVHFFFTHDSDNSFVGKPNNEIDGQQWQFMVPMEHGNVGARYANVVRVPLQAVVTPRPGTGGGEPAEPADEPGLAQVVVEFGAAAAEAFAEATAGRVAEALEAFVEGSTRLVAGATNLLVGNDHASVVAVAADVVASPDDGDQDLTDGLALLIEGFSFPTGNGVRAGVGVVDMTPDVGYGAGQYSATGGATAGTVEYGVGEGDPGAIGDLPGAVEEDATGGQDPYFTAKKQRKSYGVQSRLTARAIVVEGSNGKRIALLKSDNYLAQDNLLRRVGQILEEKGSGVGYDQILYHVTHAHSTTYASTLSAGVFAFQDAYDARFFEFQARKLADAILAAEADLAPARMGATTVRHTIFKGNIMGPSVADDGTPAQYPREYGDHGLVVMRFDHACTGAAPSCVDGWEPMAVWINWGEHPEGLDGLDLHSADFVAFLERFVERDLGVPLVYSQGDVGSAERSGNAGQRLDNDGNVCNDEPGETCPDGEGVWRDWDHQGYAQNERNVWFLAEAVVQGWEAIGEGNAQVPFSSNFVVDFRNAWVPGPVSHPYPSVSNCRDESTVTGDPGAPILGLPDCSREVPGTIADGYGGLDGVLEEGQSTDFEPIATPLREGLAEGYAAYQGLSQTGAETAALIYHTMRAEGVPVPDHYDALGFGALEENLRLKLQAFRLGDVVLGSCACEAQVDLILNFESRADDELGNIYDGFDWACVAEDQGLLPPDARYAEACELQRGYYDVEEFPTGVPGKVKATAPGDDAVAIAANVARMRAQVHNDARGWDLPQNAARANSEPENPAFIWGNFTRDELPQDLGYKLAVGVGHAGDYNGYTVSYREYMSHDHYRKALTSYGPHTADYMVTRLVRMAGAMKGGSELAPEPHDAMAQADEARQVAVTRAHGQAVQNAYDAYYERLPPDVGPPAAVEDPADITLFDATQFIWRGGSTQVDNPVVKVQLKEGAAWNDFADMTGEVQTLVRWPLGLAGVAAVYAGGHEWEWVANFEAFESFPADLASTPPGTYRFVVDGCINDGGADDASSALIGQCRGTARAYRLESAAFDVAPWTGGGIPKSYASEFPFIQPPDHDFNPGDGTDLNHNGKFCRQCTFRPWAE